MIKSVAQLLRSRDLRTRQALRFGMPVLVFLLLMMIVGGAVYYTKQQEREANQKKLISNSLWTADTIQFQIKRLAASLDSLASDVSIYKSGRLKASLEQLARSSPGLVAVYRDPAVELFGAYTQQLSDIALIKIRQQIEEAVNTRMLLKSDGVVGPFTLDDFRYIATVNIGPDGYSVLVGIVDMDRFLQEEMPKWLLESTDVTVTDLDGNVFGSATRHPLGERPEFSQVSELELGGLALQLRTYSNSDGRPVLLSHVFNSLTVLLLALLLGTFLLLWRDSRQRLEIEEKLRDEKQFRQSMQDSMAVGLRVWGLDGVIRYVNPAFCNMVGYEPHELIGVPQPLPYWPTKSSEEYKVLVANVLSGNAPPDGFETVYQHRSGRLIDVLIVEAPLRDGKGEQTGWMSSVIDITDRKRSEALVAEQREKLQAASRFALVGEVATNIAHELNQPLATMVSFAQAGLNLAQRGASVDKFAQLFEKLRDQAQRAGRVVGSVQNLVRKRKPQREHVRVDELMDAIRFMVTSLAVRHDVRLHFQIEHGDWVLFVDRIMVEQAVVNLVKNAAEAFTAAQRIRNVWIATRSSSEVFEIAVRDDGPGLSLNNPEKMFEALVSTKPDGLGLGLSLCRSVAEAHGGRLRAEPVPTGGTCFTMNLPMALKDLIDDERRGNQPNQSSIAAR
ncbi:PAS domain S-box protein [Limnobacter humi]|uniref:histidine kinase n=1 Tax=Limnobacter humi TaxID=1778671 RepID=A0ABT1WH84_9BURK|nr:PAS domain S-box protein [Limnobacter humi]MCQ8896882.1 PAS domain S-box protein [Limnobacter humi]